MNKWTIDPAHTEIGFRVKHLMISIVRGKFDKFQGEIMMPGEDFGKAEISFSAEAQSIDTGVEFRDNHLRSADFFDAANFPALSFKSKSVALKSGNNYSVSGDLTMRGVTKEILLDVLWNGFTRGNDGGRVTSFEISGSLSRKEFGLLWNKPIEGGGVTVSDEVKLDITAEFKEEK
jgi:polyisoprenoid-binding protein YceI